MTEARRIRGRAGELPMVLTLAIAHQHSVLPFAHSFTTGGEAIARVGRLWNQFQFFTSTISCQVPPSWT